VLKAAAGTAATGLFTGVITGDSGKKTNHERLQEDLQRANQIRAATGDTESGRRYLSEECDHHINKGQSFSSTGDSIASRADQQDPSARAAGDSPVTTRMDWTESSVSTDLDLYYYTETCESEPYSVMELTVTLDSDNWRTNGAPEADHISISWNDDHYRYKEGTAYQDSDMDPDNLYIYEEDMTGCDWEWRDNAACPTGCGTKDFYVGCEAKLYPTDQERAAQASYWDHYKHLKVCGVSFGADGSVGFTICESGEQDQHGYVITDEGEAKYSCRPYN